jgi:N-hydroxyarylamine O-acetyltransferase
VDVQAYLDRIGARMPAEPTAAALAELQVAHLLAVPFENLDIAEGRRISLDLEAVFDKVVRRRRGGFCYELNGLFCWALTAVGFDVTMLAARTVDGVHGPLGPESGHLTLRVDIAGEPWLADVGFGDSPRTPLPLDPGEHEDALGRRYRFVVENDEWDLLEHLDERSEARELIATLDPEARWRVQYRFTMAQRRLEDFLSTCRWQETESSFFAGHRFCTIATPDGRRTFMDDRLIVRSGSTRTEQAVAEEDVPGLLRDLFGVVL